MHEHEMESIFGLRVQESFCQVIKLVFFKFKRFKTKIVAPVHYKTVKYHNSTKRSVFLLQDILSVKKQNLD